MIRTCWWRLYGRIHHCYYSGGKSGSFWQKSGRFRKKVWHHWSLIWNGGHCGQKWQFSAKVAVFCICWRIYFAILPPPLGRKVTVFKICDVMRTFQWRRIGCCCRCDSSRKSGSFWQKRGRKWVKYSSNTAVNSQRVCQGSKTRSTFLSGLNG